MRSSSLKGDYNEVIKLSLILLGKYPNDIKTPTIHYIGAISHARWMAKVICKLHIALFSSQLVKLKVINETEAVKHKHLALFLILYYIPNWIECSLPFEASRLDLQLYQRLSILTQKTKNVPVAFVESIHSSNDQKNGGSFGVHMNESLVFLALFYSKVREFDKEKCHQTMLQNKTASQNTMHKMGKLVTPANISKNTKLCQLFGPDSRLIPSKLNANIDFLEKPAKDWLKEQSYISLKTTLKDLQVTNDAAERSI